jgi:ribosomal-protein-alanine N-acetyltransferase
MIAIRQGDARDIAGIMAVMNEVFDPEFGEAWTASQCLAALTLPANRVMLAVNQTVGQTSIVGFALSRWVLDEEELLMIAVAAAQQRQSVGRMLLQSVIDNAKIADRQKLYLEVRDGNGAHSFYKSIGFQEVGRRKQYYRGQTGQTFDAISMAKTIQ